MALLEYRRDLVIDLDEGQLAKLKRIWTTDSCPRRQYHRIIGDVMPLPPHYMSWKGSAIHRIIEKSLVGEQPNINWLEFPDQQEKIEREAQDHLDKFARWMTETEIDLDEAEMEVKYEVDLPLGYVKVRKIDVLTPTHQLDWKTGKKRNTIDSRIGLAAGWDAVRKDPEGREYDPENLVLIFTGGDKVEELAPFTNKKTPIEDALDRMQKQDEENIFHREQIKAGKVPPCKSSFFCGSCPYRHVCRGI